ncbi:hypothetical protein Tco_0722108 [Tanacetum coccineum]
MGGPCGVNGIGSWQKYPSKVYSCVARTVLSRTWAEIELGLGIVARDVLLLHSFFDPYYVAIPQGVVIYGSLRLCRWAEKRKREYETPLIWLVSLSDEVNIERAGAAPQFFMPVLGVANLHIA